MKILQFVAEALGDASYLVISGQHAAVIDPQRDVRPYLESAAAHGATIELVFETHVHNDYVSGGRELVARGAEVVAPADSGLAFPHRPVRDGDRVAIGDARLQAVAAPGHTYEHTAYLAIDEQGSVRGAFTGGAILMAAAGRSDLLGPDHTEELTRLQWESARRLAGLLPDEAEVLPTHGAGSFCSTSGTSDGRRGPLAAERGRNPVLVASSYAAFRALHLATAMPVPAYYRHMAPINRAGPRVFGVPPSPPLLLPGSAAALAGKGIRLVDVRARPDFVKAHVPGSVLIEESSSFVAYAGWLLPFNAALALVAYDVEQAERVAVDLFRIGYEDVRGYLPFSAWSTASGAVAALPAASPEMVLAALRSQSRPVIDVRYRYESAARPLPGAIPLPIDDLSTWAAGAPTDAIVVCESGQRAVMAASFLASAGKRPAVLAEGGATDLLARISAGRSAQQDA